MSFRIALSGAALAAITLVSATPPAAFATTAQATAMMQRWAASDRCAAQAKRTYPDLTPEANAKRDAAFQQCLAASNLPPRELSAPPH